MIEMILTDEEIGEVRCWPDDVIGDHKPTPYDYIEAGAKAQAKALVEWLTDDCTEHPLPPHGLPYVINRYECNECWQALLEVTR